MQTYTTLDALPLWGLFVTIMVVVLLSIEGGYRLGRYNRSRSPLEKDTPIGTMVGATLGLLAFMLAFTFGMATERYDTRRQVVLDEANAIGTAYLRAALLPDQREEIRALLRDYVNARLESVQQDKLAEGIRRSVTIQERLWAHTVAIGEHNPNSIVVGLFVQSLNEVIDLHAKRVTAALRSRIPEGIWAVLFAVAALSVSTMGYYAGILGTNRSLVGYVVAVTFSAVLVLVADLDRPQEGALKVSQQALVDLRQSMKAP